MGGYSPDWVGYPICTEGPYSCLWTKACAEAEIRTRAEFLRPVLAWIFAERGFSMTQIILMEVADFL